VVAFASSSCLKMNGVLMEVRGLGRVLLRIILLDGLIRIMIVISLLRIRERNGLKVMNLKVLIFGSFFFKVNFEKWIMCFNFVSL